MDIKIWSRPLRIETKRGQFRIIATTEEALRFMANQWPMQNGVAYDAARQVCQEAIEGSVEADMARKAFVEACAEAGFSMLP